jgi:hypothetical protein
MKDHQPCLCSRSPASDRSQDAKVQTSDRKMPKCLRTAPGDQDYLRHAAGELVVLARVQAFQVVRRERYTNWYLSASYPVFTNRERLPQGSGEDNEVCWFSPLRYTPSNRCFFRASPELPHNSLAAVLFCRLYKITGVLTAREAELSVANYRGRAHDRSQFTGGLFCRNGKVCQLTLG